MDASNAYSDNSIKTLVENRYVLCTFSYKIAGPYWPHEVWLEKETNHQVSLMDWWDISDSHLYVSTYMWATWAVRALLDAKGYQWKFYFAHQRSLFQNKIDLKFTAECWGGFHGIFVYGIIFISSGKIFWSDVVDPRNDTSCPNSYY